MRSIGRSVLRWTRILSVRTAPWGGLLVATLVLLAACGGGEFEEQPGQRLTVFAASSLTDVFNEIAREFEREHAGVDVVLNLASSAVLRTQLEQGARADVFASADERQMELAERAGVIEGQPVVFAMSRLALIVRSDRSKVSRLEDLATPGVRIAIAAPQVPVRVYTDQALDKMAADPQLGPAFVAQVRANRVTEALNVRQAVATVELGEADVALAYVTDAVAGAKLKAVPLPDRFNVVATFPIATVGRSSAPGLAREFISFVRSERGRAILQRYGFATP